MPGQEQEREIKERIAPLLTKDEGIPVQEEESGQIRLSEEGKLINPVENLDGRKDVLWYKGPNHTEEAVQLIIGDTIRIVNVQRTDAKDRGVADENSISGGFVDPKNEKRWGSGQTIVRELFEETGQNVKANQLIELGGWYCHDPRNSQSRWIETKAFLLPVLRDNSLSFKSGDDASKVEPRVLDANYLNENFYADHKKSILTAVRTLQDRTGLVVDNQGHLTLSGVDTLSLQELSVEFSKYWINTGPNQLQRIRNGSNETVIGFGVEIARRELLLDELLRSGNPVKEFLNDLRSYSVLFESMTDGVGFAFPKFINENFPLLGLYARNETSVNSLATQDYPRGDPGLPGYDWSLFDKGLIRMSKNLVAIQSNNGERFSGQISKENFEKINGIWNELKESQLDSLFIATTLHLDIAKGGTFEERKRWKEFGVNPFVHNEASFELIRKTNAIKKIVDNLDLKLSNNSEKEKISELFEKMIEYHGYIGQWVRGEVTGYRLQGLTDWVNKNSSDLDVVIKKLGIEKSVSEFIGDLYYLINVVDTMSVKDGLYGDHLNDQFLDFKSQFERVISGNVNWGELLNESLDEILPKGEEMDAKTNKKREFLADRLTKLRGGKDYEEALGTFLELGSEKIDYIFDLLEHSQLWYVENASAHFSVENQLKLLVLASRLSKEKGIDAYGNFDVNFAPLMNTLRPNGNFNKALTRIVDTALYGLSWDEIVGSPNKHEIIANGHLKIELAGENGITGINCVLDKGMTESCNLINAYYTGKREDSPDFRNAVESLNKWSGIRLDEWDRVFDQETYMLTMNSSMNKKIESIMPAIDDLKKKGKKIVFIGIGSGTGELEHALSGKLGKDDLIIGTDISRAMVENMKRIAKIVTAERYLDSGANIASLTAIQADALHINIADMNITENPNTAIVFSAFSVNHEFASYVDGFKYGDFTAKVYENLMSKGNYKPGDEIIIRDFIQEENPGEKITLEIGKATGNEKDPGKFIRDFSRVFKGFTDSEKRELSNLPETLDKGTKIQISKGLAMEIMGHYSWLKDGKSQKELQERYGYFDTQGFKDWFDKIASDNGIKIDIEIESQPAKYEDYIGGKMDAYDSDGKLIPVPLNMATIVIKRIS